MKTYTSHAQLWNDTVHRGHRVPSRFGDIRELVGPTFVCTPGYMTDRRRFNPALGFMELLQVVGGTFDLEQVGRVTKTAPASLFTPEMAYGPRLARRYGWPGYELLDQFERVAVALLNEPHTRQAVLFLGDPADTCTSSLPCTTTYQFLRRGAKLWGVVNMRSWDLLRGFSYDTMVWGGLCQVMARLLGLTPWQLVIHAGSAHVYEKDLEVVPSLAPTDDERFFTVNGLVPDNIREVREWARTAAEMAPWPNKVPPGITYWPTAADSRRIVGGDL